MLNNELQSYLKKYHFPGSDGFSYFISNAELYKKNIAMAQYYAQDWVNHGYGDYTNTTYDIFKMEHKNHISVFDFFYNTTQFFTFGLKNKNLKLYKGITVKENEYNRVINQNKIKINKLSSFTEKQGIGDTFAYSTDKIHDYGILSLVININSNSVLMSYKDWLSDTKYSKTFEEAAEYEYVVINPNNETYSVDVKIIKKYEPSSQGLPKLVK